MSQINDSSNNEARNGAPENGSGNTEGMINLTGDKTIFRSEEKTERIVHQDMLDFYVKHEPLKYGKKFYIGEFLAERFIQVVAFLSIAFIIAIFYYVFSESRYAFINEDKENIQTETTVESESSAASDLISESYSAQDGSGENTPERYNPNDKSESSSENDLTPERYSPDDSKASPKESLAPERYVPDGDEKKESTPVKNQKKIEKKSNSIESTKKTSDDITPERYESDADSKSLTPERYVPDGEESKSLAPERYSSEEGDSSSKSIASSNSSSQDGNSQTTLNALEQGRLNSLAMETAGSEQELSLSTFVEPNDTINGKPSYIWQPIGENPKYSFVPLAMGALKVTIIGLLIAAPIAILAAIFTVAFAPRALREIMKPAIEILAGFPSIVIGFFCLSTLASVVQEVFGTTFRLNSFVGGVGMALAVIPIIYTVTEDALAAVPKFMKEASLALGASRWQTALRVTLPAATPGVFAAIILGFGRAFGETMIALLATGNAALVSWDIFESVRTLSATIGAEMAEVEFHSVHYGVLFLIGSLLFVVTFSLNAIAEFFVRKRLLKKFQGK
jgi:phosphate transport system permease protein